MDCRADTNEDICLWILHAQASGAGVWKMHGLDFSGLLGFEYDFYEDYTGKVAMISAGTKAFHTGEIGHYHSFFRGFSWVMETDSLPPSPFLLTSDLDTYLIFDGAVDINFSKEEIQFMEGLEGKYPCPVMGEKGWFGGIFYNGTKDVQLTAYSNQQVKIVDLEDAQLYWSGEDSAVCPLSKRIRLK